MSKFDRRQDQQPAASRDSRRDFLKAGAIAMGGAVAGGLALSRSAHAAEDNTLKLGLIGCGGRGSGAIRNALNGDPNTKVVAMADAFDNRLQSSLKGLLADEKYKGRVDVDADHQFVGLDAYQKLIDSGVDVVLLTTPPQFRPVQLKAAIDAGKHVFCEKPVAVDAPGVRSVLASAEAAKQKGLSLVSGLCWRYHNGVKETMKRILDGQIGEIRSIQENYLTGALWSRPRQPGDTEMKFQVRNWYNFTWLSGDFNVEQHVHSLDKALWAFHDEPPLRAYGLGGRQVRVEQPAYGNIYDHMAVVYVYPNDAKVHSYCRQQSGCYGNVDDHFLGTKGNATVLKHRLDGLDGENIWRFRGSGGNMYDLEHEALFASIRAGDALNNGLYMARSTMLGIMGRMVCYTGKGITWEEALNSQEDLSPDGCTWDSKPPILPDAEGGYPVATPGQTPFV